MANSLHGDGPPPDASSGGDVAEKQPCPVCGKEVKNVGVHLRYRCQGAGGA